jgi:4-diphosphocytidyl-2-C-methyl-D-erythritol kinase
MPAPAPAKINLFLHVLGRRPDGYHLLDSLAVFAGAADLVSATVADDLTLTLSGPFAATLAVEPDNLVLRAARALAAAGGVPAAASLVLEKNLPVASGIGGGSADAAAALRILAELWRLDVPPADLAHIAAGLGADVPVCLASAASRMGGIGDLLGPAPALPSFGLALINPGAAVATPAIFRARTGAFSSPATLPARWESAAAMAADLANLGNDLQAPARALCPAISDVLQALATVPGCLLARMSGSGATCFGLFASPAEAETAAAAAARPGWWTWGGAPFPARGFTGMGGAP